MWEQNEPPPLTPNPTNIWAITFSPDTGWGTAEKIENDPGSGQVPQIAFDNAGNAIAVWHQYDGSTWFNVRANTWSPGSDWGTPETIETSDDSHSWDPQIVIDSANIATVVWASDDGATFNIWSNTWSSDSGWGSEELIETDNDGDAFNSQIAVDDIGNLIPVWRHHYGTRYNIQANRFE